MPVAALLVAAFTVVPYFVVPMVERRMTFHPGRYTDTNPPRVPATATELTFPTGEGLRLSGWFFAAAAPKTGVTVLFLHGNSGTLEQVAGDATLLQAHGFDVLALDYRGFGRSEGQSTDEAGLLDDGRSALRYLTVDRGVAPNDVALFGQSLGTVVAADLAASGPCRAAVLMAPLASAKRQARDVLPWLPSWFDGWMQSPLDTESKIGRAHCPVLVVHGDADGVIAVAQGIAVYRAAREPRKLIVVPNGGHVPPLTGGGFYVEDVLGFLAHPPAQPSR